MPTKPSVDFDQEVRFAVVMYGGSSLAIYINGVAQELLRLVRATAPEFTETPNGRRAHLADEELRGSERVYRRLGRLISRQGLLDETNPDAGKSGSIRTRFVVDILTGTSAGGINAVYLAKALANDQDMDELHKLWVEEGDIGKLLNDKGSYTGLGFILEDKDYPGEPWSLLNSRRMHLRLLEALRQMEATREEKQGQPKCPTGESPLVDELDLFVTATDMEGLVLKLRLADKVASEYRHRNVFRFRYRGKRASGTDLDRVRSAGSSELNELGPENNAFLAFAARATSAHQAAFSPVKFDDSTHIVAKHVLADELPADARELRIFYQDYLLQRAAEGDGAPANPDHLAAAFRNVWFVDGGTLDNKPFSFVIDQLPLRHAETFVDRKLLYVEPSPEHLKRVEALTERPRIKENALAALSSLPRYESIVEDLKRLLERNRLVERLSRIMLGAEEDLIYNPKQSRTRNELRQVIADREQFIKWLQEKGPGWGSYQRLRVAEVTDDLTLLVARAAGFSEESDEFQAIRQLVRDWRERNYDPHMEPDPNTHKPRKSQLEFLIDFDLSWAMRRIRFCLGKLNELDCLDTQAEKLATVAHDGHKPELPREETEKDEFRAALRQMRWQLNESFLILRNGRRRLWSRDYDVNPFRGDIASLELTSADLLNLLRQPTDKARSDEAELMLKEELTPPQFETRNDAVVALTNRVRTELTELIDDARVICSKAMRPPEGPAEAEVPRWELFLRQTIFYYYKYFEDFDQISYPILYSTGVGEEIDVIDVFRVSPEDATALIDESKKLDEQGNVTHDESARKYVKLAGTTLSNFGAFLRETFRVNDILWGRLDGAERVIAALLPANENLCQQMTKRAHRAIIVEDMLFADQVAVKDRELQSAIWDALDVWDDPQRRAKLLGDAAQRLPQGSSFRVYVEKLVGGEEPIDLFREAFVKGYDESRRFEEDASIESVKRAQSVLSGMVLGYFPEKNGKSKKRRFVMWLGKRLRIFVESALEPEGKARSIQRWKLRGAYLLSLVILTFVCLPAVLMMVATKWPWPGLFFLAILVPTFLFAIQPLAVTVGYHVAWRKLRRMIETRLQSLSKI
ncbi:MAG TPA: patatin-like protein [Pyrinomonadaceae bacterium]|nr:patatin-like protein [Pyrinomonadaceae bacterium]